MAAVIQTGGKQYIVKEGDLIRVEKIAEGEKKVEFQDLISGKKVVAEVVREGLLRKLRVFKYRPRKNYRKTIGHRQAFSELKITGIEK